MAYREYIWRRSELRHTVHSQFSAMLALGLALSSRGGNSWCQLDGGNSIARFFKSRPYNQAFRSTIKLRTTTTDTQSGEWFFLSSTHKKVSRPTVQHAAIKKLFALLKTLQKGPFKKYVSMNCWSNKNAKFCYKYIARGSKKMKCKRNLWKVPNIK